MKTHSDELAVFVQVVESGSFSRAAERLGLANSVVSRTVKRLEDKLSANLLNRTTRQLRLTEEGCRFFERARQILHDIEAAEAEILSAGGTPQGVLRVDSATPTLLHLVAPLVLRTPPAGVAAAHLVRRLHRPHRAARGHRHPRRQPARLRLTRPPFV